MVLSLSVSGICIRYLALEGVALADNLTTRGLSCLIFVFAMSWAQRLSLKPKSVRTQVLRAFIAGLALTSFSMSYQWLTASTVSVLSNIDVPLLMVLGPFVGIKVSNSIRGMALTSILFLVWYISGLEVQVHLFYGLTSLMVGTFLLCFGYFFIKKSMAEENEAITILVPSLAIIAYGLAQRIGIESSAMIWTPKLISIAILSGFCMFGAYFTTMKLYSLTDLASAEFPTLISSIVIQPIESIFLGEALNATYLASSIGFVLFIYFILSWQNRKVSGLAHA